MSLDAFLHNLHFNIEEVSPSNWEVNWNDAPLTYKLYKDLPRIPLSLDVPLTLTKREVTKNPDITKIGHFLWYVYGLSQICQSAFASGSIEDVTLMQSNRRFVPSGGALYPNELYVYLKCDTLPTGIYHYDVARHCLVMLREGNYDSFLSRALGNRCDVSNCFGAIFVSTMFWKNFFKYNNFSYRLQGLDTGVLIGQILEMAKRFGFEAGVYFQFLDRAINHLLGLRDQEESVYSIVPLSLDSSFLFRNEANDEAHYTSTELCKEIPVISHKHYSKSKKIIEYPMIVKMNEVSMIESSQAFRKLDKVEKGQPEQKGFSLPKVNRLTFDLATISRERFSPDVDFIADHISQQKLANLLYEATDSFCYKSDLDGLNEMNTIRPILYVCLYNIENIKDGAYLYDQKNHALQQVQLGDQRLKLQYGMSGANVNLFQVPICLHVAGDKKYLRKTLGLRGYRIQQMEAGMMIQRLLIAAAALGMGGHPLLGFDSGMCDEIYQLTQSDQTCLIQMPIGHYRNRPWLQGSLHS